MIERFVGHLRYSSRALQRAPMFTLTAVLSLAIGIGANVAIFSIANALLLAPTAGLRDMHELVDIGRTTRGSGFDTISYPTYRDLAARVPAFDGVFAYRLEPQAFSLGGEDGAQRIYGQQVSANYFDVLGVTPAAGGFFGSTEETPGVPLRRVVLSHAFWQRQYAGAPTVIGSDIVLNGEAFTVAGVAARNFQGTSILAPDLWVPLTADGRGMMTAATLRSRENVFLVAGARLRSGASVETARAQLDALAQSLAAEHPDVYRHRGFAVAAASRLPGEIGGFVAPIIAILMGVVGLVLLVACTNLAGLLLSRAADRQREVSVRLALGASRRAIAGMLLSETMLIFGLGAAAGIGVAALMARGLGSVVTALPVPAAVDLSLDWRVLTFALALTCVTALLTGLAPALQATRQGVGELGRHAGATPRRQRLRRVFIAAQLACCLVLVIGAGLFARALSTAAHVDPGFVVDGIDVASLDLSLGGYDQERIAPTVSALQERLGRIAGVTRVAAAAMVPLNGGGLGLGALRPLGATTPDAIVPADWNVVSPEFLETLGTPVVNGRHFTRADGAGAADVAIVNERFAASAWPGENPIGKVLENGDFRPGRAEVIRRLTVVGVARDVKYRWIGESPRNFIYVPLAQHPMRDMHFFLRRSPAAAAAPLQTLVRQELRRFDAYLPLVHYAPLRSYADLGLLPQRIAASVAGSLGVVALLLAAIGVYGVTAFAVASRTREIGVRIALGADGRRVRRDVLVHGLKLAATGTAIGIAVAAAAAPLASDLLFGISPLDPLTFTGMAALLCAIAAAAMYVPAQRAARIDPIHALRSER